MRHLITLNVNGKDYPVEVRTSDLLLDVLRNQLGLTGTKEGCKTGDCGACTVLVDGKAYNACLLLAIRVKGKKILTIEGLKTDGKLHALQQTFIQHGAVQCGFCTSGMLISAKALLNENPDPSEEDIRLALAGNLCRCTGYKKIVEAVQDAAALLRNPTPAG